MRWSASQALSQIICGEPLKLEAQEWKTEMGPGIAGAQMKLAAAISQGQIRAFGRRTPHAALEGVPADILRIADVEITVSAHGDIVSLRPYRPYLGEQWQSIEFEADEVKRLFPGRPKPCVEEWMHAEASKLKANGIIGKRDLLVADCRRATRCTKREAEAAHRNLPQDLRRGIGKPTKNIG